MQVLEAVLMQTWEAVKMQSWEAILMHSPVNPFSAGRRDRGRNWKDADNFPFPSPFRVISLDSPSPFSAYHPGQCTVLFPNFPWPTTRVSLISGHVFFGQRIVAVVGFKLRALVTSHNYQDGVKREAWLYFQCFLLHWEGL